MRSLIFALLLFVIPSFTLWGQQEIEVCENLQSVTYSATASTIGTYYWTVDSQPPIMGNTLTVDWSLYPLGYHTIELNFDDGINCPALPVFYTVHLYECEIPTMFAPNAFTPDGTNLNEIWHPVGMFYKELNYMIFNRWGELIFYSESEYNGWDGTYKAENCQQDVYVYVLNWTDNKNHKYRTYGHITLLR